MLHACMACTRPASARTHVFLRSPPDGAGWLAHRVQTAVGPIRKLVVTSLVQGHSLAFPFPSLPSTPRRIPLSIELADHDARAYGG